MAYWPRATGAMRSIPALLDDLWFRRRGVWRRKSTENDRETTGRGKRIQHDGGTLQDTGPLEFRPVVSLTIRVPSAIVWGSWRHVLLRRFLGGVAQLGERLNGIQEVRGSIPLVSIVEATRGFQMSPRSVCAKHVQAGFNAGIAQLVEHNLAKVGVAGSSPVSRSGSFGARELVVARAVVR